jgi:hypothetical protein
LILDFSSSTWIFFVNRALINQKYTVKFQHFAFLNLLNQFCPFFSILASFSRSYYFLDFFWIFFYIFFCIFSFSFFFYGNPKMDNNKGEHEFMCNSYITCVERWWVLKDVCCRVVNNITVKYRHQILRLDDMLDGLLGSCIFFKNWFEKLL